MQYCSYQTYLFKVGNFKDKGIGVIYWEKNYWKKKINCKNEMQ